MSGGVLAIRYGLANRVVERPHRWGDGAWRIGPLRKLANLTLGMRFEEGNFYGVILDYNEGGMLTLLPPRPTYALSKRAAWRFLRDWWTGNVGELERQVGYFEGGKLRSINSGHEVLQTLANTVKFEGERSKDNAC